MWAIYFANDTVVGKCRDSNSKNKSIHGKVIWFPSTVCVNKKISPSICNVSSTTLGGFFCCFKEECFNGSTSFEFLHYHWYIELCVLLVRIRINSVFNDRHRHHFRTYQNLCPSFSINCINESSNESLIENFCWIYF